MTSSNILQVQFCWNSAGFGSTVFRLNFCGFAFSSQVYSKHGITLLLGTANSSSVVKGECGELRFPNILWETPFPQMISGQGGMVIQ